MINSRRVWLLVLSAFLMSEVLAASPEWRPLFNGKDLSGWESWLGVPLKESAVPDWPRNEDGSYAKPLGLENDRLGMFRVEEVDGAPAIHVSGEGFATLTTKEMFSNYHLRLQFKWGEKKWLPGNKPRNAGLLYHAHGEHGAVGGRWKPSHQFQIEEGGCGDYIGVGAVLAMATAKKGEGNKRVYDPKGEPAEFAGLVKDATKCLRGAGMEVELGKWNTLELICVGDECVQRVNGAITVRMTRSRRADGEALKEGCLQLQIEGSEIYFRGIEVAKADRLPDGL